MLRFIAALLLCVLSPLCAARTVPVGIFSFDTFIPGDAEAPGVNAFVINNLTGDFSLAPEFPALTPVEFLDARVSLSNGAVILLGTLGPGAFLPDILQFSETEGFEWASFSAVLGTANLNLADGTTFTAATRTVTADLDPLTGFLQPGVDFQVITLSDVPEPGTSLLVLGALSAVLAARRVTRADRA